MHLDGARVFNAAAALGVEVRAITELVSTVQFCLSKVRKTPKNPLTKSKIFFGR